MTEKILRENNWPEDYIRGVLSHGWGLATGVEPIHPMEKVIYTIDELTGLIYATALMRPSKSLYDLKVKPSRKMEAELLCSCYKQGRNSPGSRANGYGIGQGN